MVWIQDAAGRISGKTGKDVVTLPKGGKVLASVGAVGQPRDGDSRACYVIYRPEQNTPDKSQESVATKVSRAESLAALNKAMSGMPERFRLVLTAIGQGRSYSDIGDQLGMTKQGVHKIAAAAMHSLKEHLESQGYGGLDSVGLLESLPQEEIRFGSSTPGGLQIPGYSVKKELGRGGFGAVYQARRKTDGAQVAIKVMLSQTDATEEDVLKFQREMDVNSQLEHPNIVRFVESGAHQGAFYFVMALCDGGSFLDLFNQNRGPLTPEQLMPHALKALEGIAFAHSKGFVHRDLKPGNILIHKGMARIADFGMAKSFQLSGLSEMSMTGKSAGTPVFMPPEQIVNF